MNSQGYDESSSSTAATSGPTSGDPRMGKKQRFMNLIRTTKDVYIPLSISNFIFCERF